MRRLPRAPWTVPQGRHRCCCAVPESPSPACSRCSRAPHRRRPGSRARHRPRRPRARRSPTPATPSAATTRRSCAPRGSTPSRSTTPGARSTPRRWPAYRVVVLAQRALSDAEVAVLTALGAGRREPHRDAPGPEARRRCSGWPAPAAGTVAQGYLDVDGSTRPGQGHHRRAHAVPRRRGQVDRQRGAHRGDAAGRDRRGDGVAGGDAARRRHAGRAGRRVHVRPRGVGGRDAPGQPGARGRRGRRPAVRAAVRRPVRRRLARLRQGPHPAGRRAAAPAREPRHADVARRAADAALLVPPARREGRRGDDRRRPCAGRDDRAVRPVRRRQPAGCSVAGVGVHARDVVPLHRLVDPAGHRAAVARPGLRALAPPEHRELHHLHRRGARGPRRRPDRHAARERRQLPPRRVDARPLRRVADLGGHGEGRGRTGDPARHGLLLVAGRPGR